MPKSGGRIGRAGRVAEGPNERRGLVGDFWVRIGCKLKETHQLPGRPRHPTRGP